MNQQIEILITFLLYLAFFGWVGWLRGRRRTGFVLAVAVISWLLLNEQGDIFVRIANLGKKFLVFIQSGGLSSNPDPAFAALRDAPPLITGDNRGRFVFIVWVLLLVLAYVLSGRDYKWLKDNNKQDGWAVLWGIVSGFFFASVLLPRLIAILLPAGTAGFNTGEVIQSTNLFRILGGSLSVLREGLSTIWTLVEPQAPFVILLLLTLLLVIAASTLQGRGANKAK